MITVPSPVAYRRDGRPEPTPIEWDREELPYLPTVGWTSGPDGNATLVFHRPEPGPGDPRPVPARTGDRSGLAHSAPRATDVWVELMPGVPDFTASGEPVWIGRENGTGERRVYVGDKVISGDSYVRAVVGVDGDRVLFAASPAGRPGDQSLWLADTRQGHVCAG